MRATLVWVRGVALWVGAGLAAVAAMLLVWRGPWWFDGRYLDKEGLRSGSAALVTGFRTAAIQTLAAVGAGVALLYTARNYRLTTRGQVTDRFTKALERLGSVEPYVRLGGILALEQIVQDAPDQATHAARVLNAFVKERAPLREVPRGHAKDRDRVAIARRAVLRGTPVAGVPAPLPEEPAADVQAALTALTRPAFRRHVDPAQILDLTGLHLQGVWLNEADLSNAWLRGAVFSGGLFGDTDFSGADLSEAVLIGASLYRANLTGTHLERANLCGTQLTKADLTGTHLAEAEMAACRVDAQQLASAEPSPGVLLSDEIVKDPVVDRWLEESQNVQRLNWVRQWPVP